MANCQEINSSIFLCDKNLTSRNPVYIQGKLAVKMYVGEKLVYSLKRAKKVEQ